MITKFNQLLKTNMFVTLIFFFVLSFVCTTLYKSIQNDIAKRDHTTTTVSTTSTTKTNK